MAPASPAGDAAELDSVASLMTEAGAAGESCALGSVKALIGHTKTAAGAVGLAKVALALYHRTLPPQPGIERPVGALGQKDFPLYVTDGAQPWLARGLPDARASAPLALAAPMPMRCWKNTRLSGPRHRGRRVGLHILSP